MALAVGGRGPAATENCHITKKYNNATLKSIHFSAQRTATGSWYQG